MIESHDKGTLLLIRVKPGAKKSSYKIDIDSSEFVFRVKSPAKRGQANAEVIKLISKRLGIASNCISIIAGVTSSKKTLLIEGMRPDAVMQALQD